MSPTAPLDSQTPIHRQLNHHLQSSENQFQQHHRLPDHPVPYINPTNSATKSSSSMSSSREEVEDFDDYEALPENTSLTANLMAGAFAGIMEHTVMFPVDAIKTRMQVASAAPSTIAAGTAGASQAYSGIVNAVTSISAAEGARSLWRGVSSVVLGAGPAHAVYFAVYEAVKNSLGGNKDAGHHPFVASLAGASATISSDALMNPFDVIKQRMQLNGSRFNGFADCASQIYRKEGLSAFYVSYPTTLLMNVPFTAINFTVYESACKVLNPNRRHDPLSHCLAGGLAGAMAAAVTTPLDVIKTMLQTKGVASLYDAKAANVNSFMDAARYIYQRDGLKGFARGMRPRVVSNMPSTAICWTSYEMAKFYLVKSHQF